MKEKRKKPDKNRFQMDPIGIKKDGAKKKKK
jgi:hypothetical protein